MKGKLSVLALTALLFLGMNTNALAGNSFNFLGETTWTVTINENETGPITPQTLTMTGGISRLGTNYYLFQGSVQIQGDGPLLMAGSGNIVGGTLFLTLTTSQKNTDSQDNSNRHTGVMHVEINPSDLDGTFYVVSHNFDRIQKSFHEQFIAGTLTRTGSPIPLSPSVTGPQSLLLLQ